MTKIKKKKSTMVLHKMPERGSDSDESGTSGSDSYSDAGGGDWCEDEEGGGEGGTAINSSWMMDTILAGPQDINSNQSGGGGRAGDDQQAQAQAGRRAGPGRIMGGRNGQGGGAMGSEGERWGASECGGE